MTKRSYILLRIVSVCILTLAYLLFVSPGHIDPTQPTFYKALLWAIIVDLILSLFMKPKFVS